MKTSTPFSPRPHDRFQNADGYEIPLCFHRWEYSPAWGRWRARVTFYDGYTTWAWPERQPETRILIVHYIMNSGKAGTPMEYAVNLYNSLGWIARSCVKLGQERGYGRGKIRFELRQPTTA